MTTNRRGVAFSLDEVKRPGQRGQFFVTGVYNDEAECDVGKEVAAVVDLFHGEHDGLEALQNVQVSSNITTQGLLLKPVYGEHHTQIEVSQSAEVNGWQVRDGPEPSAP